MRRTVLLLSALLLFAGSTLAQPKSEGTDASPQNVILLIPDGFGPASATMARDYLRWRDGTTMLALDSLQKGAVRTFAADSRITDSAAGATAFATGVKTYNGAIAVDTTKRPVATILEGAERKGMATGLVVTSRLTHATPAAFSVHFEDRWMENQIAARQITKDIEVLLGGGRRHFLPKSAEGSAREDDRNLIDAARSNGYQYVSTRDALLDVSDAPVLGLFSRSHMSYEIDRNPTAQPSLETMTQKALALLSDDEDGFFLMVEGSRIDHAGHANDAAAHLHDILAFHDAVKTALDYARTDGNTLVVTVSDHETGGLSLGRTVNGEGIYAWKPAVLAEVTASHGVTIDSIQAAVDALPKPESGDDRPNHVLDTVLPILSHFTGITDLSSEEKARLRSAIGSDDALNATLSDLIGKRAIVGWTTGGHTAVDVNLYAYGPGAERFTGNRDNTYVGQTLADLLGVDLETLTTKLRAQAAPE